MPTPAEKAFEALMAKLQADTDVLSAFLSGSRGKGFATPASDYDVVIVVHDDAIARCQVRYPFHYDPCIDCVVVAFSKFRTYAALGSPDAWDRYAFTHVKVLSDRTGGEVQALVDEKGRVPYDRRDELLRGSLDAFLNGVYRALKCVRNRNDLGARLEAANSVAPLLEFLFALEGRHAPFAGYLERELATYPLRRLPLTPTDLLDSINRVLQAEVATLQKLLRVVDVLGKQEGFGDVFEAWGEAYPWMQRFTPDENSSPKAASKR